MRVIIAGSRTIMDYSVVEQAVKASGYKITSVVCGMARGVDMLGHHWAIAQQVPVTYFPADWEKYGKSAGFIRNAEMSKNADALIAVTNGSPGTRHMIGLAIAAGLKVHVEAVR